MGDLATLAKARLELEELYLGVPDESVNLTFQDLADVKQNAVAEKKKAHMEPIHEVNTKEGFVIGRLPSLDFSKGLEAAAGYHHHHHVEGKGKDSTRGFPYQYHVEREGMHASRGQNGHVDHDHANPSNSRRNTGFRTPTDTSLAYDDVSGISIASKSPYQERGGRRRSGIPHSNICTICSVYIYIFRHRCLVCGRVYCRQCVSTGMGEMTEGRKCIECLGRRFSQRYIQRAGMIGCCSRYPSMVKQQELKWAEKGPRRSGERGYGRSGMMSRSRSPVAPLPHTRAHGSSNPSSFVMSSPYSAHSPTNHPIPF